MTSKTTSKRRKTAWPVAFTFTMSTSRMESATCSTYHNHDFRRLQSSTVLHLHSQSGFVNFEHASTSVSLSTSTSWTSPTMRRTHLQPTSCCSKHQQDVDNVQTLYVSVKHVKTSEMNVPSLKAIQHIVTTLSSIRIYNKYNETSMRNKYPQDATTAGVRRAGELLG